MAVSFYELLFLIQLFVFMGIFGVKVYNLMRAGSWYDLRIGFLLYFAALFFWALGLVTFMADAGGEVLFNVLFRVEIALLAFQSLFLLAEIFFHIRDNALKVTSPRNSRALDAVNRAGR